MILYILILFNILAHDLISNVSNDNCLPDIVHAVIQYNIVYYDNIMCQTIQYDILISTMNFDFH